MPELPEVEAVCCVVGRALRGQRVIAARVLRPRVCAPQTPAQFARAVAGRKFERVERRGKNIVVRLEGVTLWIHLRMTGNLYAVDHPDRRPASTSAYLVLDNGRALVFDDPRGLGVMRAVEPDQLPVFGIDSLSPEFTPERLVVLAQSSRAPIKLLLMNQERIGGLGNIYAAEALWRAGIDPRRAAHGLSRGRLFRLYAAIRDVLAEAVPSAIRAYARPGRFSEGESFELAVYDREGEACRRCGRPIRRIQQGGRSTYFCGRCQR